MLVVWVLWPVLWVVSLVISGLVLGSLSWFVLPWWLEELAAAVNLMSAGAGAFALVMIIAQRGLEHDFRARPPSEDVEHLELGLEPGP